MIAVGVVVVLAVTALALRPADDLLHSGKGPLGRWGIVAIALTVAWVAGVMFATERLRRRIRGAASDASPRAQRLRQAAVPALVAGPAVLGVLALVLHHFTHRPSTPSPTDPPPQAPSPPDIERQTPPVGADGHGSGLPLYVLLGLVAAAALVLLVLVVVRRLWRHGLPVPSLPAVAGEDEDRELLLSAIRSGRRALDDGADARAAVIACYAAMEDALAASGVDRRASDSPADLLTRATRAGLAAGPAAPRLTTLFREARYSSHPMDDTQRTAAADALEEIAAALEEHRAVPEAHQEREATT
ncbi:DUF4129 domain-containing protein [Streptomyces longispororuber]|uniref:DUF4129 domain-containing protein n=1 Tax=Streptomyces longispororuber TaxID=68230 RepID=UPI00210AF478|nr:DUF4129 domain-containing protein [Streptomyces longispororuber]MCQ4209567.1 DUF4129 domain-containing protein [Streptomyces longispororuber]